MALIPWLVGSVVQAQNMLPLKLSENETTHDIMALIALQKTQSSNTHAQQSTGASCLIFSQVLRLLLFFMCANSKGSGETVQMHSLA